MAFGPIDSKSKGRPNPLLELKQETSVPQLKKSGLDGNVLSEPAWCAATANIGAFIPTSVGVVRAKSTEDASGPVNIEDLSPADQERFVELWIDFTQHNGMEGDHRHWHEMKSNGSGGVKGPGSGEPFIQYHSNLMLGFLEKLKTEPELFEKLHRQLPKWDMNKPLPKAFQYVTMNEDAKRGLNFKVPAWLTPKGDGTSRYVLKDERWRQPRVISSLNDIKSVDELGRVLGASGVHGEVHVRLGGIMVGNDSLPAPPFVLWHAEIERIRLAWLQTPSGQAAAALYPPDGYKRPNANGTGTIARVKRFFGL